MAAESVNVIRTLLRAQEAAPELHGELEEAIRAIGVFFAAARFTRDFILTDDDRNFGADLLAKQLNDGLTRCGAQGL